MTLLGKALRMFGFHRTESNTVNLALSHTRKAGEHADHLNAILRPYLDAEDPFKAFAVDVFERGQESRIHKGPPR